jgi:methyl-accepting chemotaxis protein
MSATSEELATQAEQLQAAISYFRVDERQSGRAESKAAKAPVSHIGKAKPSKSDLRDAVMASAPHMAQRKAAGKSNGGGGFALDLDDGRDELDGEFARRSVA